MQGQYRNETFPPGWIFRTDRVKTTSPPTARNTIRRSLKSRILKPRQLTVARPDQSHPSDSPSCKSCESCQKSISRFHGISRHFTGNPTLSDWKTVFAFEKKLN